MAGSEGGHDPRVAVDVGLVDDGDVGEDNDVPEATQTLGGKAPGDEVVTRVNLPGR